MNKSEFIAAIAAKTGSTKEAAAKFVDAYHDTVSETLAAGDQIAFTGFGTYLTRQREAREGRNPRTGETVHIAASKTPALKPGKTLKDRVNA